MRAGRNITACVWLALLCCACRADVPEHTRSRAAHASVCASRKKSDKHHKKHARKKKHDDPSPSESFESNEPLPAAAAQEEPEPEPEPVPPPLPPSAADEPLPDSALEPEPEPEPEPEAPPAAGSEHLHLRIVPAAGGGARHIELPTRSGTRQLDTGLIAALGVDLSLHGMVSSQWLLAAEADYRTLAGLKAGTAASQETSVRSHSLGLAFGPGYRFGERGSVEVRFLFGWALRGVRPVTELTLPSVSFHGPLLRPELHIPIAAELITLRIAPELIVPLGISTTLPTGSSGFAQSGLGIGGELSLDVRVAEPLYLGVEYRESRVKMATSWGADLFDIERFATARVVLQY